MSANVIVSIVIVVLDPDGVTRFPGADCNSSASWKSLRNIPEAIGETEHSKTALLVPFVNAGDDGLNTIVWDSEDTIQCK